MNLRDFAINKLAKELRSRDFHTRSDGVLQSDDFYENEAAKQILKMSNLELLDAVTPDFDPDFRIHTIDGGEICKLRETRGMATDEAQRHLRLENIEDAVHRVETMADVKVILIALVDFQKRRGP